MILEQCSFADLLNVVKVNRNFAIAATHVFNTKYSTKRFFINTKFKCPNEPNVENIYNRWNTNKYSEEGEWIGLYDYNMIIDTFKYFEVKHLKVLYVTGPYEKQAKIMAELISNNASGETN